MKELYSRQNKQEQTFLPSNGPTEEGTKINGLQQVVDLLRFADPAFRESLLKRLTQRDPKLATSLRKIIR